MTSRDVHSKGFYGKHPEVTWDLAEERWLDIRHGHVGILILDCRSCGGCRPGGYVLARPERVQVEEFIARSLHWYECPQKDPQIAFIWLGPAWLALQLGYELPFEMREHLEEDGPCTSPACDCCRWLQPPQP